MRFFRYSVLLVAILCLSTHKGLFAQFYSTGEPPASVKWMQINTDRHQIIFPSGFEMEAQRMAGYLDNVYSYVSWSLDHEPRKIPVTIHNFNARSNGMVIWAPRRMEIYPVPPQRFASNDWLYTLAVHEQRHVVQVDKMNRGGTRFLSYLMGEQAHGLSIGRIPFWFLEGDAVSAETALSQWGRGRQSAFEMPLRTILTNTDGIFSYDKSMFGSYRDFVPDHYIYGYHMVAALRSEYGIELWQNALDYVADNPWSPAPFAQSLRQQTGKSLTGLHAEVSENLQIEWIGNKSYNSDTQPSPLNQRSSDLFTSYRSVRFHDDTTLFALKSGIAQIDEFVSISQDGEEETIYRPGFLSSHRFALSGKRIAWSEFQPDPRWGLRNYSVIKVYDISTRTERAVTHRTRFFSPVFAPDGLFLAVIETTLKNNHYIVILDSVTGEEVRRYPSGEGVLSLTDPRYTSGGNGIVAVAACSKGKSIVRLDLETGNWDTLLPPAFRDLTRPVAKDGKVYFHSDISGVDQIYSVHKETGELYRITDVTFGAFDPEISACGKDIYFSNYTEKGYDIVKTSINGEAFSYGDHFQERQIRFYKELKDQEPGVPDPSAFPDSTYNTEPYKRWKNLFNFHSWSPFYFDYDDLDFSKAPFSPGITLLSQNILNTANTAVGYAYKNGNHVFHGNFVYRGWYPVIEVGFDYGEDPQVFQGRDTVGPGPIPGGDLLNLRSVISVPLNFTHNRYRSGFIPSIRMNYNNSYYHYTREDEYRRGMFTGEIRLFAYRYLRQSLRDINPRWGQSFRLRHLGSPFEDENLGSITSLQAALFFPGLFPHHSIIIRGALQNQEPEKYLMRSLVEFPRGYNTERTERLQLLQADYHFPVAYPDFSIPSIVYLKRVRSHFFADYGANHNRRYVEEQNRIVWEREELFSFGLGINTDLHIFRLPLPFDIGGRIAHVPSRGKTSFTFFFGMDMSGL